MEAYFFRAVMNVFAIALAKKIRHDLTLKESAEPPGTRKTAPSESKPRHKSSAKTQDPFRPTRTLDNHPIAPKALWGPRLRTRACLTVVGMTMLEGASPMSTQPAQLPELPKNQPLALGR
jgi:hypothetical protein